MRSRTSGMLAAMVAGAFAIGGASAQASAVTWDLSSALATQGALGTLQKYTSQGYTITATGWKIDSAGTYPVDPSVFPYDGSSTSVSTTNLYEKKELYPGTLYRETGLGIQAAIEHEITSPYVIQMDVTQPFADGLKDYTFSMASTSGGEAWRVFGSNCAINDKVSCTGKLLYDTPASINDQAVHGLSGYGYYWFALAPTENTRANVLLGHTFRAVPVPASWMLMGLSLAGLGLMGYRRASRGAIAA